MNDVNYIFLETLQTIQPVKKELVEVLTDILCMEKEAVQRRLRGSVPFSFNEIFKISLHLGISLDNILALGNNFNRTLPCRLLIMDFQNMTELDYQVLESYVEMARLLKQNPKSSFFTSTNTIPEFFYVGYPTIYRFHLMKWMFQNEKGHKKKSLQDVVYPERLLKMNKELRRCIKQAGQVSFILDRDTFRHFIEDIVYFRDIKLLTPEDIVNLKAETMDILREIEELTSQGTFETGKKANIFLSNIKIETTHQAYSMTGHQKLSLLKWFTMTDAISTDERIYEETMRWILFLQRSSTLISGTSEMERIRFIQDQKQLIENL